MKKKTKKPLHHCLYCKTLTPIGVEICGNCMRKRQLVHRLWLIGQKMLADAGRLGNKENED